jgi:hypothetical protein
MISVTNKDDTDRPEIGRMTSTVPDPHQQSWNVSHPNPMSLIPFYRPDHEMTLVNLLACNHMDFVGHVQENTISLLSYGPNVMEYPRLRNINVDHNNMTKLTSKSRRQLLRQVIDDVLNCVSNDDE